MIVIGYVTDTSIARLFLAGIIPGVLIGLVLMFVSYLHAVRGGEAYVSSSRFSLREVLATGRKALPGLGLPFIIVFGILGGIFTATEAAAVAVVYGLVVGTFLYREIRFRDLPGILVRAAEVSCVVMFIAATAMLFAWLVSVKQLPVTLGDFLEMQIVSRTLFLIVLNLTLLVIGMFMESFSAVIVFLPILFPIALRFGIDPIHFGIIATVNLAIGYITPPYGATLFVACGLSGKTMREVTPKVIPLILAMLVVLLVVTYIPESFLWVPDLMGK
jgi:C4-dicarboxylate transporter DctM subunit